MWCTEPAVHAKRARCSGAVVTRVLLFLRRVLFRSPFLIFELFRGNVLDTKLSSALQKINTSDGGSGDDGDENETSVWMIGVQRTRNARYVGIYLFVDAKKWNKVERCDFCASRKRKRRDDEHFSFHFGIGASEVTKCRWLFFAFNCMWIALRRSLLRWPGAFLASKVKSEWMPCNMLRFLMNWIMVQVCN